VLARTIEEGAADAWVTPIVMKKGRPAHTLHVLTPPGRADAIAALLFAETGTLGVRRTRVEKLALPRHTSTVDVDGHPVRVKHGPHGAKPEHDDVVAVARATGRPARDVAAEALRLSAER
jgi:pyridinium-3,5-bisthiocarboxylic acid mononucleotide nickel chelatase